MKIIAIILLLLAQHYFSLGKTRLANKTLSDILTQFEMDELETKEIEVLQEYYSFYASLQADSAVDLQQLDSVTIEQLKGFEFNRGIAGTHATALLLLNGASDYREPVYMPEEDLNTRSVKNGINSLANDESFVVYPNPANNYFYLEYNVENSDSPLLLLITDMLGKTIYIKELVNLRDIV
ncbi:MAG: hypothetical protein GX879_00380 [Bacteroidales bacterium]|nr:hypothetical protein [Bacteroidales bacterium]